MRGGSLPVPMVIEMRSIIPRKVRSTTGAPERAGFNRLGAWLVAAAALCAMLGRLFAMS